MTRVTRAARAAFLLAPLLAVFNLSSAFADTGHVREFAKNKPGILIITSGPHATDAASQLQGAILAHKDNRHSAADVRVLPLRAADAGTSLQDLATKTIVFVLSGDELSKPVPERLAGLLPLGAPDPASKQSVVKSVLQNARAGEQTFRVALAAPDANRLKRLMNVFIARATEDFRGLPFEARFSSNRVAVFSAPEYRETLSSWGMMGDKGVWDEIVWYSLADRDGIAQEMLADYQEVYFQDRSHRDPLPPAAARVLQTVRMTPTSFVIARSADSPITVVSAPSGRLLQRKAIRYRNLRSVPSTGIHEQVLDLRTLRSTVLLSGGAAQTGEREALRDRVARDMRQKLGIPVDEAALAAYEGETTLRDLQDNPEKVRRLRASGRLQYVWLLTVNEYGGNTEYRGGERQITPDLAPFTDSEPEEPSTRDRDRDRDKYNRDLEEWRRKHRRWREKRDDWREQYEESSVVWERNIERTYTSRAQVSLRLIDLEDGGRVLWENVGNHSDTTTGPFQTDRVSVRGFGHRPSSLTPPPPAAEAPAEMLRETAYTSAVQTLQKLEEEAWLPDGSAPAAAAPTDPNGAVSAQVDANFAQVAAIDGRTVTITAGSSDGLTVGQNVTVVLKAKVVKHPQTGAVLETLVQETLTLRLTRVGATSDGVPATPEDAARLAQVKVGMPLLRPR